MGFLMLLRSGGKLCGWLERDLWEYSISKDNFDENRPLCFSSHFFFLPSVCVCLLIFIFLKSVWGEGCVYAVPSAWVCDSCLGVCMNCTKAINKINKSWLFLWIYLSFSVCLLILLAV